MQNKQDNKRKICNACEYPESTCVCKWISPICSPIKIVILQHPQEAKHAKNTVKLLQLGMENIEVLQGETSQDFGQFVSKVNLNPEQYCLCYPSDKSIAIESPTVQNMTDTIKTIIFIDASWRKALKMWHLNPWLQELNSWHFDQPPINQYKIRHTSQKNSLSTLEAVTYVLTKTQNTDCSALLDLFKKMQQIRFLDKKTTSK